MSSERVQALMTRMGPNPVLLGGARSQSRMIMWSLEKTCIAVVAGSDFTKPTHAWTISRTAEHIANLTPGATVSNQITCLLGLLSFRSTGMVARETRSQMSQTTAL